MSLEQDSKEKGINRNDKKESAETGGLLEGIRKIIRWVKEAVCSIIRPIWKALTRQPAEKHVSPSPDLSLMLKSGKRKVLDDISALLKRDTIKDETDRKLLKEAAAFIENPTENPADIKKQTMNIGQVLGGYEQQGAKLPPEIDALHRYLLTFSCINQVNFIEKELKQGSPDLTKIKQAMVWAIDPATHLSRAYNDGSLLSAVNELQRKLDKL